MRKVPELSLLSYVNGSANDQVTFVNNIISGLKDYGFIILVDHIVSADTIQNAYASVEEFFSLPTETKMKYVSPAGGGQRGYTAFGLEHAKDNDLPDLKEFWHVGREVPAGHKFSDFYPANIWPTEIAGFQQNLQRLYDDLHQTSEVLLEAIGRGFDLPKQYFNDMVHQGNSILRPIHYPALDHNAPAGAVRSASHEDINLITILVGATASGLELLDHDGQWLPVKTAEGQLIVDTGDMMKVLTNDVLPATTHRVVNPDDNSTNRYSMPFFVHPNPETILDCIPACVGTGAKYRPINAHQYLLQRLKEIGLMG